MLFHSNLHYKVCNYGLFFLKEECGCILMIYIRPSNFFELFIRKISDDDDSYGSHSLTLTMKDY